MEKLVPYANVQTVTDGEGNVQYFQVSIVAKVPGKASVSDVDQLADNVKYRPVTMYYDDSSSDYTIQDVTVQIDRDFVGLMERGVYITVAEKESATLLGDPESEGLTIDYDDLDD